MGQLISINWVELICANNPNFEKIPSENRWSGYRYIGPDTGPHFLKWNDDGTVSEVDPAVWMNDAIESNNIIV